MDFLCTCENAYYSRGKSFCKSIFQLRMDLKMDRNKAEMKERKKLTQHLQKYAADVGQSSGILSSLPCFCLFSGPYLTEMKFYRNFFPQFLFFFSFLKNHFLNRRGMHLLCLRRTLFVQGTNAFCTSDEHFSAGNERVE